MTSYLKKKTTENGSPGILSRIKEDVAVSQCLSHAEKLNFLRCWDLLMNPTNHNSSPYFQHSCYAIAPSFFFFIFGLKVIAYGVEPLTKGLPQPLTPCSRLQVHWIFILNIKTWKFWSFLHVTRFPPTKNTALTINSASTSTSSTMIQIPPQVEFDSLLLLQFTMSSPHATHASLPYQVMILTLFNLANHGYRFWSFLIYDRY